MKKNKNLVSQSEFARLVGVSPAAIAKAVKQKKIDLEIIDNKKYVNLSKQKTKLYISYRPTERIDGKRQTTSIRKQNKQGNQTVKKEKVNTPAKKKVEKKSKNKNGIEIIPYGNPNEVVNIDLSYYRARAEKEKELAIQKKLQNAKMRGELLDEKLVEKNIFMYIDKVHSNLERLGGSYLSDIGSAIITAGSVTPEIIERWSNAILEQIDDAKKIIMKKLKEIKKDQAGG